MSTVDPAVSPLRDVDPEDMGTQFSPTPSWQFEEICKLLWAAKKIKVSYRFATASQGTYAGDGGTVYSWYHILENQNLELDLICSSTFTEIENEPLFDDYGGENKWITTTTDYVLHDSYSYSDVTWGLNQHILPIPLFSGEATTFYFEDLDPAPNETIYATIGYGEPPEESSEILYVRTKTDLLEIVTSDNDGNPKSFFYDGWSYLAGGSWPVEHPLGPDGDGNPWTGTPADWGFLIDSEDVEAFIKVEVLEWYSHNGTWDTETGELLVADPWNP